MLLLRLEMYTCTIKVGTNNSTLNCGCDPWIPVSRKLTPAMIGARQWRTRAPQLGL